MEQRKQTAVDWLLYEIKHIIPNDFLIKFEQAKQMEEEQIRDAWTDGCIGELYELNAYFSSGKYYNETYGKE